MDELSLNFLKQWALQRVMFLIRDTMLAWYMLWSCVCPSQAGIVPKCLDVDHANDAAP